MIKSKNFSYSTVYNNTVYFFEKKNISKRELQDNHSGLFYVYNLHEHLTEDESEVFKIEEGHKLSKEFAAYLNNKFYFESKLEALIKIYDDFFNLEKEDEIYHISFLFFIDKKNQLKFARTFQFYNLEYLDNHILLIEQIDSKLESFEEKLMHYYTTFFFKEDFPEEFNKPFSKLTESEKHVLKMLLI